MSIELAFKPFAIIGAAMSPDEETIATTLIIKMITNVCVAA